MEEFLYGAGDDREDKPVTYFKETKKGLITNKTNGMAIEAIAGTDETDDWGGTRIELFVKSMLSTVGNSPRTETCLSVTFMPVRETPLRSG